MPIGPQTHHLTVNLPAGTAAEVEQFALDAWLTSTWIARIVAAAVRSLNPPQQEDRTP